MQNFHNGRTPAENAVPADVTADEFDDDLIQELANKISTLARRAGGKGMRVDFDWLADALEDDDLAFHVLRRAGFSKMPETWELGRGNSIPGDFRFLPSLAEELEGIVADYS